MKRFLSRLLALVCVVLIGVTTVPAIANADSLSGRYADDVQDVIQTLKTAIDVQADTPDRAQITAAARLKINDFSARYRRNSKVSRLSSFTTMRTALNSLAAHYSSYPNRLVPDKLKVRLLDEFKKAQIALNRGA
ncbi:photosystem II protein Psb27 [filamentous cyanobacterium LEGE 11480]|uniref:Photosystem II lipoprotein Psb27 n=1 Tax=Romeriopsis navalis LEGE 11480 TaxID=2777977 RepID=A0A928VQA2_9CYAN|nr:photosystem II protein Psb27 [Romeriopsis navalis]MBE9030625.1 photosystem II protein Psb27 [Romeriopsis navalis LEGE 11480]